LRISRAHVEERVLALLNLGPSHGYKIARKLTSEVGEIKTCTLYRWLRDMENEGLIESEIRPGPYGPNRRVYRLGPRGMEKARIMLRNAIDLILKTFNDYRRLTTPNLPKALQKCIPEQIDGRILFTGFPDLSEEDLQILSVFSRRIGGDPIYIVGDPGRLFGTGISFRSIGEEISRIPVQDEHFKIVWLSGVPPPNELPLALAECKRVLVNGGIFRMVAPFAYFRDPHGTGLEEFIRSTALEYFPDMGIMDGKRIAKVVESQFSNYSCIEIAHGMVVFWGVKGKGEPQESGLKSLIDGRLDVVQVSFD
jgi:DNA-binding PadR family transcriptional regulator